MILLDKLKRAVTTILLMLRLFSAVAHADTLSFTLTQSTEVTGAPGTLTYDATVSAPITNSAAVNLNGASYNLTGPLSVDDTDYFVNFPLFLLPATASPALSLQ